MDDDTFRRVALPLFVGLVGVLAKVLADRFTHEGAVMAPAGSRDDDYRLRGLVRAARERASGGEGTALDEAVVGLAALLAEAIEDGLMSAQTHYRIRFVIGDDVNR